MIYYVGILDGSGDIWGVRVPDLPGVHGGGDTPQAAIADAISAMRTVAADDMARGGAVPAAREISEVFKNAAVGPYEVVVILPLAECAP